MYHFFAELVYRDWPCIAFKLLLRMKLIIFFLLITLLQVSAASRAQNVSLRVKNESIEKVFEALTKQSGYHFLYDVKLIDKARPVSVDFKSLPIKEALRKCFEQQPFTYALDEKDVIIISRATEGMPVLQVSISGKVRDENGIGIPGATVMIKNNSAGTITSADGSYKISVPGEQSILMFSSVGYKAEEVTVGKQTVINIKLTKQASNLNDVVVVGYGTQRKGDLTGSVAGIKEQEIQQAKSTSFMEAMQGRLAGVQVVSSSGEPGSAVNVVIRGTNSFNSGTQPLYVIDGVQIDVNTNEAARSGIGNTALSNPLAGISPNDIASMEVLKDASATAIFGSRGANGVVVITTKSGKNNTSVLEFNNYAGIAWAPKHIQMLGAQDYARFRLANGTADGNYAIDTNGDNIVDQVRDLSGVQSYDWQREALRTAVTQNYSLSYSGGSTKTSFFTSASYLNQQGLIINNNFERYGLLAKITHNATNRLRLGVNVNLSHAIGKGVASNGGNDVRNNNGIMQMILLTRPLNAPDPTQLALDPDGAAVSSPVDFASLAYKRSPLSRALADLSANYRIINGLNLDLRAGAVLTQSKNGEFYPTTVSWGFPSKGLAFLNTSSSVNWYQTSTLTYNKRFNQNHSITLLAGFEVNSYEIEAFRLSAQGFDIQNINPLDNIATAKILTVPPSSDKQRYVRVSEFARLNYNFKDKYLLTATLRNDASSKLAEGNKSALFPSVGLAWRASKEKFLENLGFISDLKFRGSFGLTGNERIPPYQSLATLSQVFYASVNNTASLGVAPNVIANPNLKWETTYAYDAGLDLSLFKDRVSLTADVYLKQTKDLLLQADIPAQSGFLRQFQNLGQIDNKGVELALSTINIKKANFTWSSSLNISVNRNKVVSLGSVKYIPVTVYGGPISTLGRVITGQPIGTAYGYVNDGVYQLTDFIIRNSAGTIIDPSQVTEVNLNGLNYTPKPGIPGMSSRTARPGDLKYRDLNGDGIINENDATVISNSNPQHYGGLSNSFTYKNFDLNVLFNWSYGNDILYVGRGRIEAPVSIFANPTEKYWTNRWRIDNPSNVYPSLLSQSKLDVSSYYTEDASFLRLKNLTLGYNLNNSQTLKKLGVNGLRVYLTGVNLYTWTGYSGFDPEVNSYSALLPGVDNISYPRERSIIFGLNIKL